MVCKGKQFSDDASDSAQILLIFTQGDGNNISKLRFSSALVYTTNISTAERNEICKLIFETYIGCKILTVMLIQIF
jgi:hypothetical protein